MKKRFWKWNAILSFLAFIWMFIALLMPQDGKIPTLVRGFSFIPGYIALTSCLILVRNRKKSNEVPIASFNYEKEIAKRPKLAFFYPSIVRSLVVGGYTLSLGFSSQCLPIQNDYLKTWLLLGTLLLGGLYILFELFNLAKKLGEMDE